MLPSDTLSNVAIKFNNVDLPEPDSPIMATNSPLSTVNEMPFSAVVAFNPLPNVFFTFLTSNNIASPSLSLIIFYKMATMKM